MSLAPILRCTASGADVRGGASGTTYVTFGCIVVPSCSTVVPLSQDQEKTTADDDRSPTGLALGGEGLDPAFPFFICQTAVDGHHLEIHAGAKIGFHACVHAA